MELTGYVLRRNDTGLYWNKRTWSEIPHVYMNTAHIRNAAHYHCDGPREVNTPYTILKATVKAIEGEILLEKSKGDNKW